MQIETFQAMWSIFANTWAIAYSGCFIFITLYSYVIWSISYEVFTSFSPELFHYAYVWTAVDDRNLFDYMNDPAPAHTSLEFKCFSPKHYKTYEICAYI